MFVLLMSDRLCMVVVSLLKCVLRQAVVDLTVVRRCNCCLVYNAFHLAGTSRRNIFYVFFILVLFTVCKIFTFHVWFLIHFLLVVVALPKKTCSSLKNLLVLVVLEHGVSAEGKVVEVVLDEEL